MSSVFEDIKNKLQESCKGKRVMVLSESEVANINLWLFTPTYDLNRILSGSLYKGVAEKTHTLLVGPEASGKSSFMCLNLAAAQKEGYTPVIINAEGAWTQDFVARWGLDASKTIVINSSTVEEIHRDLANIKQHGITKLAIALDSIGALSSHKVVADAEKGDIKADQGSLQKKIKAMMKTMVDIVKFQDSIAWSAGHYYGDPSGYGDPEKIGGGKYPRLAADYIVTLKKYQIYENPNAKAEARGKVLGTEIHAATIKNRFAPPFQEALFEINYKSGVNSMAGMVKVATDMGLIVKGGSWYTVPSLGIKCQGEANLYKEMDDIDLKPFLEEIENTLKTEGYSSVNNNIEEEFAEPDVVSRDTN
jgi:recombination protein RecA